MKMLIMAALAFWTLGLHGQDVPRLEFFCELKVTLDPAVVVGDTPRGTRRIIPITGGIVKGPNIKGEILKGGADWQVVRKDGVAELEAHYQFKTDDGTVIYIKNVGVRVATPEVAAKIAKGENVDASLYYFRTTPRFEAPTGEYAWINDTLFICIGERNTNSVVLKVWRIL